MGINLSLCLEDSHEGEGRRTVYPNTPKSYWLESRHENGMSRHWIDNDMVSAVNDGH
jgi:hypothetical protein